MGGQLTGFMGIVAGYVGDHSAFTFDFAHDCFQDLRAFFLFLVNAFAGGTADIQTPDALVHQMACQFFCAFCADVPLVVIAGIKCRDHTLIFALLHCSVLSELV